MHKENKYKFVESLAETLKLTRAGSNIRDMHYEKFDSGTEFVVINFTNQATRTVDVTADSEIAIMQDVIKILV